jgi:uncharacterized protein (DUF58 family)
MVAGPVRGLRLEREPDAATLEEGSQLEVTLRVRRGRLPLAGGWLATGADGDRMPLRRASGRPVRVGVPLPRRGRHQLVPARVRVGDPFGMYAHDLAFPPLDTLVLPRLEPVTVAPGAAAGLGASGRQRASNTASMEVDSLRPHRPGAPASRIHWPTVARTGTLIERRLTDEAERLPLVVVDPQRPQDADALDRALRAAASLCVHLARTGGCSLLLPGDRRAQAIDADLHAWPALHARLALVEADELPGAASAHRAGIVLWVTARAGGVPPRLARVRAGERYLVGVVPRAGRAPAFTVAGCYGQRLRAGPEARAA